MRRQFLWYRITDPEIFKRQVLDWAARFDTCSVLDSNGYADPDARFDLVAGAGRISVFEAQTGAVFGGLRSFSAAAGDWLFGHFSYEVKNETEPGLVSRHPLTVEFPDCFFFVPQYVILLRGNEAGIGSLDDDQQRIFKAITEESPDTAVASVQPFSVQARLSRREYTASVEALRDHMRKGDCYEVNFCQEFFGYAAALHPGAVFRSLRAVSPTPFSAFYRTGPKHLLCASPERYLARRGDALISQPVKGTAPRYPDDAEKDAASARSLRLNPKEQAENVMVVDLVRNDLSKVCRSDSVEVRELFGIYAFPQVYQMISTVTGLVRPDLSWSDLVRGSFPMGSMTGAPKRRVMELIEQYERSRRGIYSGAVGYVAPDGDFDFNVVIRSIACDTATGAVSWHAGSAITFGADAEAEYQECLLKAAAMEKALRIS